MPNNCVKLFDTVTIIPSTVDRYIKDSTLLPSGNQSLKIDIVATHAGRLTRNWGFYLPQKMRDAVKSFTDQYEKPVLLHHNSHEDPIGRIISARYVDTSNTFARDSRTDSVVRDLCNPKTTFYHQLSLIDEFASNPLLTDPAYPGLGHIVCTCEITSPDAIQKILDKRYMTVSIGASTDKAVCSICKKDWVSEDGPCEHRPGKVYDEKMAFIIAGELGYEELSFVNSPADTMAKIIMIQNNHITQDSIVVENSDIINNVSANLYTNSGGVDVKKPVDEVKTEPVVAAAPVADAAPVEKVEEVVAEPKAEIVADAAPVDPIDTLKNTLMAFITAEIAKLQTPADAAKEAMDPCDKCKECDKPGKCPECKDCEDAPEMESEMESEEDSAKPCEACKAAKDMLLAAQQTIEDLKTENKVLQDQFLVTLNDSKNIVASMYTKLNAINGAKIDDLTKTIDETKNLSMEQLVDRINELDKTFNLGNILDKVHNGMSNVKLEPVVNPTLQDKTVQPEVVTNTVVADEYDSYRKTYQIILNDGGLVQAEEYVRKLMRAGLVLASFNPGN